MDTALLDALIQRCDTEEMTDAGLAPFLGVVSREAFCDIFSRRVAHEYAAGRLSFDVADAAMNRLWAYAYLGDEAFIPAYAREVFEAFDEGEFHHACDPPGTDPEQKYTRPLILELVARVRLE